MAKLTLTNVSCTVKFNQLYRSVSAECKQFSLSNKSLV